MKGRPSLIVLGINICSMLNQQSGDLDLAFLQASVTVRSTAANLDGTMQSRLTLLIGKINTDSSSEKNGDDHGAAVRCGAV